MSIWQFQSSLHRWTLVDGTLTDQARLWLNELFKTVTTAGEGPVQLGGDIGGTSASPLVIGLQGNPLSATVPSSGQVLAWSGTSHDWEPKTPTAGTVTSVGLAMPAEFAVTNSPVTGAGTLTVTKATEPVNTVYAGPSSGPAAAPTFRTLAATDLPVGTGSVTSVGLAAPTEFTVSGSPVTGSGVLTFAKATQAANVVYAGPASGGAVAPTFRALQAADLPAAAVQTANTVYAGPATGSPAAPTFRVQVAADVPQVIKVNGVLRG